MINPLETLERKIQSTAMRLELAHRDYEAAQQWLPVLAAHPDAEIQAVTPNELTLVVQYYNGATSALSYLPSYPNVVDIATGADSEGPVVSQTIEIAPGATLFIAAYFNWEESDRELLCGLGNLAVPKCDSSNLVLTCQI